MRGQIGFIIDRPDVRLCHAQVLLKNSVNQILQWFLILMRLKEGSEAKIYDSVLFSMIP